MCVRSLNLTVQTYVGEGIEQTCTTAQLTERDFTATQLAALGHIFANAGRDPAPPVSLTSSAESTSVTHDQAHTIAKQAMAKQAGYTGDACDNCGAFAVKRTGKCTTCDACGATGGCG
jgi:hypothetical protein